jgi:hypothetical protein
MHGEDPLSVSRGYARREWISRFCAVIAAIPFVASGCEMIEPLPADAYLLRKFAKRRAVFDRLVQMAHEDSKFRVIDSNWTSPGSSAGTSTSVSSTRLVSMESDGSIDEKNWGLFLIALANGTMFGGSMKGYFHIDSDEQPKPILAELPWRLPPEADVHGPNGDIQRSEAFRKIENHWFLYRIDD